MSKQQNTRLEALGGHFIVGLTGPNLTAVERKHLRELNPTGIILFAYNCAKEDPDWPRQTRELRAEVEATLERSVIFSVDHEGGKVHRLPAPATKFPAARDWRTFAGDVGAAMGAELAALGFNLNFAPVLDVDSEASNPVIGARSFSTDTLVVAAAGVEFMKAMQAEGVLACGKHFPGHGATTKDSHLTLPTVENDRDTILNRDVAPFLALMQAGLKMIMTAHVIYPALDADRPATVSHKILTELLRGQLKFSGVIISDALEMRALDYLSRGELAEAAISAGVDLLLLGQNRQGTPLEDALEMAEALEAIRTRSAAFKQLCHESGIRISHFKKGLTRLDETRAWADVLGCKRHQELLQRISSTVSK